MRSNGLWRTNRREIVRLACSVAGKKRWLHMPLTAARLGITADAARFVATDGNFVSCRIVPVLE
jgi:hypothetical protein